MNGDPVRCPTAFQGAGSGTVAPTISSISPSNGSVGKTIHVTINGTGLSPSPSISPSVGISVSNVSAASSQQISADFAIEFSAPAGNQAVSVTVNGQRSNSVNFFIQVPDHLVVVADTNGPLAACPSVVQRKITFAVVDTATGNPGVVPVQEQFAASTNTCGNGQPVPSVCANTDLGTNQFTDIIEVASTACPPTVGSCGYGITDHWQWCPSGLTPKTLGTLTETVHADQITVNNVATPSSIPSGTPIFP